MKKTLLFLALIVGASNLTYAQAEQKVMPTKGRAASSNPEQMIERRVQHMTKMLNLTTQQQASIKQILTQGNSELEPIRQTKDKQQIANKKRAMEQKIEAVLTPSQKLIFDKKRSELMQKNKETKKN